MAGTLTVVRRSWTDTRSIRWTRRTAASKRQTSDRLRRAREESFSSERYTSSAEEWRLTEKQPEPGTNGCLYRAVGNGRDVPLIQHTRLVWTHKTTFFLYVMIQWECARVLMTWISTVDVNLDQSWWERMGKTLKNTDPLKPRCDRSAEPIHDVKDEKTTNRDEVFFWKRARGTTEAWMLFVWIWAVLMKSKNWTVNNVYLMSSGLYSILYFPTVAWKWPSLISVCM